MNKPSGMTVVTAGLGALALFHICWSWGTKGAEPWPQQLAPTASAMPDIGTTFLLHSGAWRSLPTPREETPASAVLLAPTSPATADVVPAFPLRGPAAVLPEAQTPAVRSVPIHKLTPPTPPLAVDAAVPVEQFTPPVDTPPMDKTMTAPMPPPAAGRMALAGPPANAVSPPPGGHTGRPAPADRFAPPSAEFDAGTATPSATKFGHDKLFRLLEDNRF